MKNKLLDVRDLCFLDRGPYSFSLGAGECVGITGDSGIGKTQLFRAMTDLIPSTGSVCFKGRVKESMAANVWRSQVTMLPTDSAWWFDTVGEHFRDDFLVEQMPSQLDALALDPDVARWQVARLSTGEKQRLGLLRTLQLAPQILLLDEPTSGLDRENTKRVEKVLLQDMSRSLLSLMWISHDTSQLERVCSRILRIERDGIHCISSLEDRQ